MTFGTQGTIKQLLDGSILERFQNLDQGGKIAAEYVWLGGTMADLRSKTKTLTKAVKKPEELPDWNYDGSSTDQAPGSVRFLYPFKICLRLSTRFGSDKDEWSVSIDAFSCMQSLRHADSTRLLPGVRSQLKHLALKTRPRCQERTLRSFLSPALSTAIPSGVETTFSSCAIRTSHRRLARQGKTTCRSNRFRPTAVMPLL